MPHVKKTSSNFPIMRKILSALAFVAAAFSAAFGVSNVYAAPSLPSGVVSGGIA